MNRVVIGFNPGSGSGGRRERVASIADRLRAEDCEVAVFEDLEGGIDRARRWYEAGELRAYLAGGGDGTIRTVAERLPPGVPIALLPLGTENLLARYLGIGGNNELAVQSVLRGEPRWVDAGEAGGRLFLVMFSCGFDADVVQRMHGSRRGNIRRMDYVPHTFRSIAGYRFPPLTVIADEARLRPARWAFVFNVPRYAMGLAISPEADPADGLLDLCTFRRGGLFSGLAYMASILLGQHRRWTSSEARQCREIRIEGPVDVPWQIDGDPGGKLPVTVRVLPRRVCLMLPPAS